MEVRVVTIPAREEFTPARAGRAVGRSRQNIYACMKSGKLMWHFDDEGHRMISRKDLIEFAVGFLGLSVGE